MDTTIKIEQKIVLTVNGERIAITTEEAENIYNELKKILNKTDPYIYYPVYPHYPPPPSTYCVTNNPTTTTPDDSGKFVATYTQYNSTAHT
jgi:hypothetical protein